jgi:transposase
MIWDDETKARAAGMKRAGMTNKQIAARLGTTVAAVTSVCHKAKAYRRLNHSGGQTTATDYPARWRDTTSFDMTGEP